MPSGVVHIKTKRAAGVAFLVTGLLIALVLPGCGEEEDDQDPLTPSGPNTAAEYTDRGWERFEEAHFSDALNDFNDAILLDTTYGEAYNGLGWTRLSQAPSVNSILPFGPIVHGRSPSFFFTLCTAKQTDSFGARSVKRNPSVSLIGIGVCIV